MATEEIGTELEFVRWASHQRTNHLLYQTVL